MNTPDSVQVVSRFFEAIDTLKRDRVIRGLKTFSHRYGINDRNIWLQRREPERNIFQPSWLSYLVRDYAVSAEWLLLGEGDFYDAARKPAADLARLEERKNRKKSAGHRKKTATPENGDAE
jgi:hypothetical protein